MLVRPEHQQVAWFRGERGSPRQRLLVILVWSKGRRKSRKFIRVALSRTLTRAKICFDCRSFLKVLIPALFYTILLSTAFTSVWRWKLQLDELQFSRGLKRGCTRNALEHTWPDEKSGLLTASDYCSCHSLPRCAKKYGHSHCLRNYLVETETWGMFDCSIHLMRIWCCDGCPLQHPSSQCLHFFRWQVALKWRAGEAEQVLRELLGEPIPQ